MVRRGAARRARMTLCNMRRSGTPPQWLADAMRCRDVMREDRLVTRLRQATAQPIQNLIAQPQGRDKERCNQINGCWCRDTIAKSMSLRMRRAALGFYSRGATRTVNDNVYSLTYLQILARMSPLPVANRLPMGLGATEMTVMAIVSALYYPTAPSRDVPEFLWPWSISWATPVTGSQNCTPLSLEPERTHAPSGVRATLRTKS